METNIRNLEELRELVLNNDEIKFKIKVVANSKNNNIEFLEDFVKIKIKQRAIEGKANKAIIEYLSEEIKIPKSKISISSGEKSSLKTIKIIK